MQAILLIGSTGHGKSTLGNYLLDPSVDHMFGANESFKGAASNNPETQCVKPINKVVHYGKGNTLAVTVIDTPGLNENAVKDLQHMIQIVRLLQNISDSGSGVAACVFVVRFDAKIDTQYKETVKYYQQLLPELFEKNIIIVMNEFDFVSNATFKDKRRKNIDRDVYKKNAVNVIKEKANLTYKPILFTIKALPETDEENATQLTVRDAILTYISTLKPTSTRDVLVAKTKTLKEHDDKSISYLDGEIKAKLSEIQKQNQTIADDLEEINKVNKKQAELESEIKNLNDELKIHDTEELVVVSTLHVTKEWQALQWLKENHALSSPCEYTRVVPWTNGHSQWRDIKRLHGGVTALLEGDFMRGLYAELRLETPKRLKYADKIKTIHDKINSAEKDLSAVRAKVENAEKAHGDDRNKLREFLNDVRKVNKEKKVLSQQYMTIEEALGRLKDLPKIEKTSIPEECEL